LRNYFHRQIQLWGEESQKLLESKKVAIIGSGGLGCSLGVSLGASGIGEFHIIDFDHIEAHNIHRQIAFALKDEGKNKADVLAQSIENRCPYTKAISHVCDFEEFSNKNIKVDLIIDATDNLKVRKSINDYAKSVNTPWIYGAVEEFNGQVCFFEESDFSAFTITDNKPQGITAPMVMHIASLQSTLALRYLAGLKIKKDFLYYLYVNEEGELISQNFDMPK
jgi:molybdopterin/thiamine biosynthesis adenylyltransferase